MTIPEHESKSPIEPVEGISRLQLTKSLSHIVSSMRDSIASLTDRPAVLFTLLLTALAAYGCEKNSKELEELIRDLGSQRSEMSYGDFDDHEDYREARDKLKDKLKKAEILLGDARYKDVEKARNNNELDLIALLEKTVEAYLTGIYATNCNPRYYKEGEYDEEECLEKENELKAKKRKAAQELIAECSTYIEKLKTEANRLEKGSDERLKLFEEVVELLTKIKEANSETDSPDNESKYKEIKIQIARILAAELGKIEEAGSIFEELEDYDSALTLYLDSARKEGPKNKFWSKASEVSYKRDGIEKAVEILSEGELYEETGDLYRLHSLYPLHSRKDEKSDYNLEAANAYKKANKLLKAAHMYSMTGHNSETTQAFLDHIQSLKSNGEKTSENSKRMLAAYLKALDYLLREKGSFEKHSEIIAVIKAELDFVDKNFPKPHKDIKNRNLQKNDNQTKKAYEELKAREQTKKAYEDLKVREQKLNQDSEKEVSAYDYEGLAFEYWNMGKDGDARRLARKVIDILVKQEDFESALRVVHSHFSGDNYYRESDDIQAHGYLHREIFERWFKRTFKDPDNFMADLDKVSAEKLYEMAEHTLGGVDYDYHGYYEKFYTLFKLKSAVKKERSKRDEIFGQGRTQLPLANNFRDMTDYYNQVTPNYREVLYEAIRFDREVPHEIHEVKKAKKRLILEFLEIFLDHAENSEDKNFWTDNEHALMYLVEYQIQPNDWSEDEWQNIKQHLIAIGDESRKNGFFDNANVCYKKAGTRKGFLFVLSQLEKLKTRFGESYFDPLARFYLSPEELIAQAAKPKFGRTTRY